MYKITKEINKFSDELEVSDESEAAALTQIFAKALIADAVELGDYLQEAESVVSVTVSKAGPYAEAEFKVPVKDFDKAIDKLKSI